MIRICEPNKLCALSSACSLQLLIFVALLLGYSNTWADNTTCLSPAQISQDRPDFEQGPTKVKTSLYVLDISDISDQQQAFTADVIIDIRWFDPRLASDSPVCRYPLSAIWHPWLQIFNQRAISERLQPHVEVDAKGNVIYIQRYYGTFTNRLDLRNFPFDQQWLTFSLISFYPSTEVKLVFNEQLAGVDDNPSISGWYVGAESTSLVDEYATQSQHTEQKSEQFSRLQYSLQATRDVNYYRWKVLLPLALIVIMSWTVFWIDPSQLGPQMGAAATAMLTLIAFLFSLRGILPPISYLTHMDYFVYGSLALVFFTSIESILTCNLAQTNKLPLAKRIDLWSRGIFPGLFIFLLIIYWF